MLKRLTFATACVLLIAAPLSAQTKPAAQTKPTATAPAKAPALDPNQATKETQAIAKEAAAIAERKQAEGGQPVNIRIELTITDQVGTGGAAKKVVTMIVGDRQRNSIRSSATIPVKGAVGGTNYRNVTINVDARPAILTKEPNKMTLDFGLEYQPRSAGGSEDLEPGMASLNERLSIVVESGKPIIVSQAADPASDRKITVELTATIMK